MYNLTHKRSRFVRGYAGLLLCFTLGVASPALTQDTTSGTQDFGGLPPGDGRQEVYGICSACHSLMIVKQQRLSKEAWLEVLKWMTEKQGMPPLPPETLELVSGYLAEHYGIDSE